MGRGDVIIEFRGVRKAFGNNVVYDKMDFDVREGETLTIIGGSGLGKSVCLKLMIGLLHADAGHVLFHGEDVGDMDALQLRDLRRRVCYVFQGGALFDSMNVLANVGYALVEHTDKGDDEIEARAIECLEMVGLGLDHHPDILELMPASLSGGMKKRVALARSIALEPEVILYDEPTTGLDPSNCKRIAEMIKKLQEQLGVTSVVVTHDMGTMNIVSDRVALLHEKRFPHREPLETFLRLPDPVVQDFVSGAY